MKSVGISGTICVLLMFSDCLSILCSFVRKNRGKLSIHNRILLFEKKCVFVHMHREHFSTIRSIRKRIYF